MWSRKRLDIRWSDLLAGTAHCLTRWNRAAAQRAVESEFSADGDALCCLSVRSAWDLLLQSLNLAPGDEVLMSALTIPDMARIVEDHGLVPVPLDLEIDTAAPAADAVLRAVTPRTKVVLVAHLFGGRIDLGPLIAAAKSHGLVFVEDCAQAYIGPGFRGHPRADASLFSFGTIKTATALGGGLAVVRDAALLARMRAQQANYRVQVRWSFFQRVWKCSLLKAVSTRRMFGLFVRVCRWLGIDYDRLINDSVRGFGIPHRACPGGNQDAALQACGASDAPAPGGLVQNPSSHRHEAGGDGGRSDIDRFRRRPSAPLMALLRRRLRRYDPRRVEAKTARGELLASLIQPALRCPGAALAPHNYWVFPVWSEDPAATIIRLNRAGFDATQGQSMCVIPASDQRPELDPAGARELLARLVYVPLYAELPELEIRRLATVLLAEAAERAVRQAEPALA
ncbi:MAG TPA: DegT/DnrJ/EryC1/StrS family aminotransferase [Planctomycetaceae bacterium]|nr:DegT/DnrJ/EryC1/StrS family aminotransferase [Planctomycetaceae bacterium]